MKLPLVIGLAAVSAMGATPVAFTAVQVFGRYEPPPSCRAWYDGCNMCSKTADNKVTCTQKFCTSHGTGFCRADFPKPEDRAKSEPPQRKA